MGLATKIRQYLKEQGIKQKFISEKCGWSKQKTSAIINGKKKLAADELAAICEALNVPYDYFYRGTVEVIKQAFSECLDAFRQSNNKEE